MDTRNLLLIIFICFALALYSISNKNWNLFTISLVLAFCSGLALYFKLIGGSLL